MSKLQIVINGQTQIEYDRNKRLPGHQRLYLERMERDMDAGIELDGQMLAQPDVLQKSRFIAVHLLDALLQDKEPLIAACCAFLATRMPDLKQVKMTQETNQWMIDLVFNDGPNQPVMVSFSPRNQH